jgi:hypothetical protein
VAMVARVSPHSDSFELCSTGEEYSLLMHIPEF